MRLVAGGESVLWARIEDGYYGAWALRRETKPAVVRAIRADEARAGYNMDGWMRWFARELSQSNASPLGPGTWRFTELVPGTTRSNRRDPWLPRDETLHGMNGLRAFGLRTALERPRMSYEDWGSCGSFGVLPLRTRSPSDAGRVKSWAKHAREGTLPPILLWWVDALSAHLILDGHDRLAAALDNEVTPQVITLWQFIDAPIDADAKVDVDAQAHFIDSYQQLFDNPNVELMARIQLNAKLIAQRASTWRKGVTFAKANPALDQTWEEEVRAAAPSDAQDTMDDMLFG